MGAGAARGMRNEVVAQERTLQTEHDGKLLQGGQAAPNRRRRHLRNVCRRDHRCGTDPEAADEPEHEKHSCRLRCARARGTHSEQHRGQQHQRFAAHFIGILTREQRADGRSDQYRGNR